MESSENKIDRRGFLQKERSCPRGGGDRTPSPELGNGALFRARRSPLRVWRRALCRLAHICCPSGQRMAHFEFGQNRCVYCRSGLGPEDLNVSV